MRSSSWPAAAGLGGSRALDGSGARLVQLRLLRPAPAGTLSAASQLASRGARGPPPPRGTLNAGL